MFAHADASWVLPMLNLFPKVALRLMLHFANVPWPYKGTLPLPRECTAHGVGSIAVSPPST